MIENIPGYDSLGTIAKYEWAFGDNSSFYSVPSGDTAIFPSLFKGADTAVCRLRVTDDDGYVSMAKKTIILSLFQEDRHKVPFLGGTDAAAIGFNDTLWLFGGEGINTIGVTNEIWFFTETAGWVKAPASQRFSARRGHTVTHFKNKLWLIGGYAGNHCLYCAQ